MNLGGLLGLDRKIQKPQVFCNVDYRCIFITTVRFVKHFALLDSIFEQFSHFESHFCQVDTRVARRPLGNIVHSGNLGTLLD